MAMNVADLRPLQVPLVQSVTEDEDDDSPTKHNEHEGGDKHVSSDHPHETMNHNPHHSHYSADPHAALVDQVRSNNNNNNREALAYLLRYETMVRQQEAEDMATIDHMRHCVERLGQLAGMNINMNINTEDVWTHEISYGQLNLALERLEQSQLEEQQSQQVQHEGDKAATCEFMTTDRQLMMVLRLLTKSVPSTTSSSTDSDTESATSSTSSEDDQDNNSHLTITWAEFLQCYKTCIVGMLTLQHLPKSANSEVRARARDRTLSMLSLFEPPTRFARAASSSNNNGNDNFTQAFDVRRSGVDRLAPAPSSSSNGTSFKNLNSKKKASRAIIAAAAFVGMIVMMAPASIPVDPIVVANNGVDIALTVVAAESILQAKSSSMLALQQKQQSLPSIFFSRTPLVVEKRGAANVRPAVTLPTAALPLTAPQEFAPLSSTPHHPTTERMVSVAPAMVGGVVGCLGAPLLVAGLQNILKQAAVTATAIGGSVSMSAASIGSSTGLLVPVLAGMGALLAVTSVVRGIWTVLHSLVANVAGRRH
jgi:hypothetical protein